MTGNEEDFAFSKSIRIPAKRQGKPRTSGLNFSGDWGRSIAELEGIIETRGEYIDYIKLAVLCARFYTKEYIKKKIELCRKNNIGVYPGGMSTEAAFICGKAEEFFKECKELGFTEVEVSESEIVLPPKTRLQLVEMAVKEGLNVHVELGEHFAENALPVNHTIRLAKDILNAGADKVCIEGAIVAVMKPDENPENAEKMFSMIDGIGIENLVFEIGNHPMRRPQWFILNYGPEVNFANVNFESIMHLEHVRRGMNISPTWFGKFATL
jgi:phosphosulfolactate synthase